MKNSIANRGGVSFEVARNAYRGSVTVNGVRRRTAYFKTRRAALNALSALRETILMSLTTKKPKSLRTR